METVYFFTDETGFQSAGRYFIVAGVAMTADLHASRRSLKEIERQKGGIGILDWHRTTQPRVRCRYLCDALKLPTLRGRMFWVRFEGRRDHWQCTLDALTSAMRHYGAERWSVIAHEGFTVSKREHLKEQLIGDYELRKGNFAEEPLIRFADRLAGGLGVNHYSNAAHRCRYGCPFDDVVEIKA